MNSVLRQTLHVFCEIETKKKAALCVSPRLCIENGIKRRDRRDTQRATEDYFLNQVTT